MSLDPAKRVPATPTDWGEAYDHHAICVNMDGILRSCGVTEPHVRRRMTAHAIWASGWRQAVWCFNAWGVKTGSGYTGRWYAMTTQEDDGSGKLYTVPNDAWRAFDNWGAAVRDFQGRISPSSSRYKKAHAALVDPRPEMDAIYWAELGKAGYYTDTNPKAVSNFASVCRRVDSELRAATPEELAAAREIPVGPTWAGGGIWGALGLVVLVVALYIVTR